MAEMLKTCTLGINLYIVDRHSWDWRKNRQYSEMAVLGGSITFKKNPIWDLKWAAVLGGRRYWEGGIGRDDCIYCIILTCSTSVGSFGAGILSTELCTCLTVVSNRANTLWRRGLRIQENHHLIYKGQTVNTKAIVSWLASSNEPAFWSSVSTSEGLALLAPSLHQYPA